MTTARKLDYAKDFVEFLNASPTPFHAISSAKSKLAKAGFTEIKEKDSWSSICRPGGKYYLTRNGSTIIAFAIGKRWKPGNPIAMVGTHTDSPCLKVKPVSKKQGDGFIQVGVETYGGGLWHTWFDRDLSFAGRAMVKMPDGGIVQKLIHVKRPILRIPPLAPHFGGPESFSFNKETQLLPIAGLVSAELRRRTTSSAMTEDTLMEDDPFAPLKSVTQRHHPYIVEVIATEAGVSAQNILDFEVLLYDTQQACLGGLLEEFVFSARLDNLNSTYCAIEALTASVSADTALNDDPSVRLIACFDHEEIGSTSAQGANSAMLPSVIQRLSALPSPNFSDSDSEGSYDKPTSDISSEASATSTAYEQTLASSFLLSSDVAHSVNPNYSSSYESDHKPEMNKGPVVKINANQRYVTNAPGIALLQEIARRAPNLDDDADDPNGGEAMGVPLQLFVVRNDFRCGSTIGPMLSAHLGARTLDLGNPILSMHSIRETGGRGDVKDLVRLFAGFFRHYAALEKRVVVD